MGGHGREMIQLGVPIADAPPDMDNLTTSTKGKSYITKFIIVSFCSR